MIRAPYQYDQKAASDEVAIDFTGIASMTDQSFAEEVNINTIVERFGLTGELPENLIMPRDGDFTEALDYQQSLNLLIMANQAFLELPAQIRARFGNNAEEFVAFASDPVNLEECRRLGLADPVPIPPEPPLVRIAVDPTQTVEALKTAVNPSAPPSVA